jgi:hypothetical protein
MENDNEIYMGKFDKVAYKEKVVSYGPWMIFDHCFADTRWMLKLLL